MMAETTKVQIEGWQFVHGKLTVEGAPPQDIIAQTPGMPQEILQIGLELKRVVPLEPGVISKIAARVRDYAVFVCYKGEVDEGGRKNVSGHFIVIPERELIKFDYTLALMLADPHIPPPASYARTSTLDPYRTSFEIGLLSNPKARAEFLQRVIEQIMPSPEFFFQCISAITQLGLPLAISNFRKFAQIPDVCLALSLALPATVRRAVSFTTYSTTKWSLFGQGNGRVNVRFVYGNDSAYTNSVIGFWDRKSFNQEIKPTNYSILLEDTYKNAPDRMAQIVTDIDVLQSQSSTASLEEIVNQFLKAQKRRIAWETAVPSLKPESESINDTLPDTAIRDVKDIGVERTSMTVHDNRFEQPAEVVQQATVPAPVNIQTPSPKPEIQPPAGIAPPPPKEAVAEGQEVLVTKPVVEEAPAKEKPADVRRNDETRIDLLRVERPAVHQPAKQPNHNIAHEPYSPSQMEQPGSVSPLPGPSQGPKLFPLEHFQVALGKINNASRQYHWNQVIEAIQTLLQEIPEAGLEQPVSLLRRTDQILGSLHEEVKSKAASSVFRLLIRIWKSDPRAFAGYQNRKDLVLRMANLYQTMTDQEKAEVGPQIADLLNRSSQIDPDSTLAEEYKRIWSTKTQA